MDTYGKVAARWRKALKSVKSFGRQSTGSNGHAYNRLCDSDIDLPQEEPKTGRSQRTTRLQDVPKGHLRVYVGVERKLFVIRIEYLNHKSLRDLLDLSEENLLGIDRLEGLSVDCEPDSVEDLLKLIEKDYPFLKSTPLAQSPKET